MSWPGGLIPFDACSQVFVKGTVSGRITMARHPLTTHGTHQCCPIRLFSNVGMKRETCEIGQEGRIRNWAAIACSQNTCTIGEL